LTGAVAILTASLAIGFEIGLHVTARLLAAELNSSTIVSLHDPHKHSAVASRPGELASNDR
jgi:hypothetical protein